MEFAKLWRSGALIAALSLAFPAIADPAAVQALIAKGQFAEALEQTDKLLAENPKDAQLRFFKGLALSELDRAGDAVTVFQSLTADYPELPEPYNNLAVLYAQQRQYDKARAALEMAIRTHPAYATAHENLGDVYSRLASEAYNKALQLDAGNSAAQTKLAMMRQLISASAQPGQAAPAPVAAAMPVRAVRTTAPAQAATPATSPKPVAVSTAVAPDADDIKSAVMNWADAWSRKDVEAYLAHYADDFVVPGGRSRSAWEKQRRARVGKPGRISVRLENMRIDANGSTAKVRFRQHYDSDTFDASANKALELVRQGDSWLIRREAVGG